MALNTNPLPVFEALAGCGRILYVWVSKGKERVPEIAQTLFMGLFGVPTPNFASVFDHPYLEIKLSSQLSNATVTEVNVNRPKLIREVHFAFLAYISVVGIPVSVQKVNTAKWYEIFCFFKGKSNCLRLFKERGSSNFFNVIQKQTAP